MDIQVTLQQFGGDNTCIRTVTVPPELSFASYADSCATGESPEICGESADPVDGKYCEDCEMWVNIVQWTDHLMGKKHKKSLRGGQAIPGTPIKPPESLQALARDSSCAICQDEFGRGDYCRQLACNHLFHEGCWLQLTRQPDEPQPGNDHIGSLLARFRCPTCMVPGIRTAFFRCKGECAFVTLNEAEPPSYTSIGPRRKTRRGKSPRSLHLDEMSTAAQPSSASSHAREIIYAPIPGICFLGAS